MGRRLAILAAVAHMASSRNLAPGEGHNVFVEGEVAVTRGRYGVSVTDLGDRVVGTHLREIGEWEQPIVDIAAELLRPGDTVWECGGHVGAHTLGLAAAVGASGLVHVWEPQRAPRLLLAASVALNGLDHVDVHGEALGAADGGRVALGACDGGFCRENSGARALAPGRGVDAAGDAAAAAPETAALASLDGLRRAGAISGGCPALIKSDVEGMDLDMLEGARAVIDACRPALLFELVQPRLAYGPGVQRGLLARHPAYACAWAVFRIVPGVDDAFRVPDVEPSGLGVAESGPMSYNLLCAAGTPPEALAPRSAALGLVRGVKDAATDALYGGPDCRAYEADLRAAGVYADIVGVDGGTICSDKWS